MLDGGSAHGRFRNLTYNAQNTRTIPMFAINRSQNRFLKNRMSTPSTMAACLVEPKWHLEVVCMVIYVAARSRARRRVSYARDDL
jgi:hypothetical protein